MSIKLRLAGDFDFNVIAKLTPGYVGADLKALTAEAGMIAVKRIVNSLRPDASISCEEGSSTVTMMDMDDEEPSSDYNQPQQQSIETSITTTRASSSFTTTAGLITDFLESHKEPLSENQLESLNILNDDFLAAIKIVQPSAKREGFATVPDICWDDIGALEPIREELRMAVVEPIRSPDSFKRVGITAPCGVLLYGPPGCGKTLLAKGKKKTYFYPVRLREKVWFQ